MNTPLAQPVTRADIFGWGLSALALGFVLELRLLPALLAGLLVFELVNLLTPWLRLRALGRDGPRLLAHVPEDANTLQRTLVEWLRSHSDLLQLAGRDLGRSLVHVLMGMIIGALLSLQKAARHADRRPLAERITRHAERLSLAFRRVVFAQFWISSINAFVTWLYLGVALPLLGVELPLVKTLVAITLVVGLLPIVGNLISNTAIFIVSLSHGLPVAAASIVYLVVIHKLEYFLNARIVGSHINARAWELLIAMLVMEAAFGIPGLIAAPIFYAYFKEELHDKGLV